MNSKERIIAPNAHSTSKRHWLVPAVLIFLSLVPLAAGIVRLISLVNGSEITPDNARFFEAPIPITLHVIYSLVFCVLGAFQFNARFRHHKLNWHRRAGRLLMVCGLGAAITGLWMTHFYLLEPHIQHKLLYVFRMLIGTAMVTSILLSLLAIRRKKIAAHRAWIIRGYAIGQGAGTQVLVMFPVMLLSKPNTLTVAVLMIASWVINLIIAEWAIRKSYPH
jgi:uncharacterized membrane protein